MARYPVTTAQYRTFVEQSGYQTQDKDSLDGTPNHPVVNVTWYDTLEYCNWLTKQLGDVSVERLKQARTAGQKAFWQGIAEHKLRVMLPSEAEWEKAARGTNGVIYPWGDKFDPDQLNSSESEIGSLSAVGIFPVGASPYGVLDLSGNVWEWTRSVIRLRKEKGDEVIKEYNYPYVANDGREDLKANSNSSRVLRGGSFGRESSLARCASRRWHYPDFRSWNSGFRVVVSPFLPS